MTIITIIQVDLLERGTERIKADAREGSYCVQPMLGNNIFVANIREIDYRENIL